MTSGLSRRRVRLINKPEPQDARGYLPIIVIVSIMLLSAGAGQWALGRWDGLVFMRQFMGLFLVTFAMFKLFDVRGFADGFQMYDLIGNHVRTYALAYPFIELGIGLASLANLYPILTNSILLMFMVIGAIGVFTALSKGLNVSCACLGTVLKVPLSTVALIENVGMALMAGIMLFARAMR